ncbi:MAG: RNA polymerase sigma factor [Desulfobacterales bacterium]|nr:RNA polymerase sigma factor [Desulfobacterales bacterium]
MLFFPRYDKKQDAELVALVARGDHKAFEALLDRHQQAVYGFAFYMLRSIPDAEDVAQEVFMRLYRTADNYLPTAGLRAYLFRIARNLCIDISRKKTPLAMEMPPEPAALETPFNQLSNAQLGYHIRAAMDQLPERQRTALHLRHVQEMNYKEIAQIMDTTVNAVESLMTRARKGFKIHFDLSG